MLTGGISARRKPDASWTSTDEVRLIQFTLESFRKQASSLNRESIMTVVGLLILMQLSGMMLANLISLLDRLTGIRWLVPIGIRPRVSWSLPLFFMAWIVSLILQLAVYSCLKMIPGIAGEDHHSMIAMIAVSGSNLIFIAGAPVVVGPGWRKGLQRIGLNGPDFARQTRIGIRVALLASPWVYAVNLTANLVFHANPHEVMQMLNKGLDTFSMSLAVIGAVILAPAAEEILFRGILLGGLIHKTRFKPADQRRRLVQAANIITSLFFGALHMSAWPAPIGIFVLSLVLGKTYIVTGRLWPCIIAHSVFNFTGVLGMAAAVMVKKSSVVAFILDVFPI
jgi:membrane protease YdiL (CAAX protease family)